MDRQLKDWLTTYVDFTQTTEPPTQYHLWSGICAIASCLQRKCWTNWGFSNVYPNLYVVLVGPPGGRKGTAMIIAKSFIQDLDIPLGSDSLGSVQALYKEIMESTQNYTTTNGSMHEHRSLSVWSEEFQVFLNDNVPGLIPSITDLFDSPKKWGYSTVGRGVEKLNNCWLTLFGAITPSLLQNRLSQDAVGGGLLSRILFVVGYGRKQKVSFPFLSVEQEAVKLKLLQDLEQIKNLAGQFQMTEKYLETYDKWYMSPSADAGVDSEKFVGYNGRRALHLKKLTMIVSASSNNDMIITSKHHAIALAILEYTEYEMPNAFYGLGRGMHSDILSDLRRFLQERGATQGHITWVEILQRFISDALPNELETYVGMCESIGLVKRVRSPAGNRVYELVDDVGRVQESTLLNDTLFKGLGK